MPSSSYIISLSSIPSRFATLGPTLESYLGQSARPERVILYVPHSYRRFPDYDGSLPAVPEGVEIRRPEVDYGPATKILPAVRDFAEVRDGRQDILFADDDLVYESDFAERFLAARARHPDAVICGQGMELEQMGFAAPSKRLQPRAQRLPRWQNLRYRWAKTKTLLAKGKLKLERHEKPPRRHFKTSGYNDVFEGFAGVLVQPRFFDEDAFDIPDVLWTVDDIWLSGIVAKNNVPIWVEEDSTRFRYTPSRHTNALNQSLIEGADRDQANRRCVEYMQERYGIWR